MSAPAFGPVEREAFLTRFYAMDRALAAKGFPPLSDFWRTEVARFVRSGCRRWTIRAGRRSGKSTTLCKLAIAWAWLGAWSISPGDDPVISFVSVNRDESAARLRMMGAMADALGIANKPSGDELALTGARGAVCRTFAATTRAVVGHTSICIIADEVAKWESRETSANPASEVAASLNPTLATQPFGFGVWSSAPWGTDDYHAQLFDAGDSAAQIVSYAPTWLANPTITEQATHDLESDPRTWSMAYAGIPGATVSSAFAVDDIAACFDHTALPSPAQLHRVGTPFTAIDASSLRGDAFAWVSGYCTADLLIVTEVDAVEGDELLTATMETTLERVAASARRVGAYRIFGDQREVAGITSILGRHSLAFREYTWSEPSKDAAIMQLRRLARERRIQLPDGKLRAELTAMKARLQPSGRIRYDHAGDRASALITACHAIAQGDLKMAGPITGIMPRRTDPVREAWANRCARNRAFGLPDTYGMPNEASPVGRGRLFSRPPRGSLWD